MVPLHRARRSLLAAWLAWAGTCGAADPGPIAAEAAAPTRQIRSAETGLLSWETRDRGVSLTVAQIPRSQALAFYRARGFEPQSAAHYADACVFQLVLRNESDGKPLRSRLADWLVRTSAGALHFVPLQFWEREWERRGVNEAARIAFRWAQFPAEQQFEAGDWIMGMAALAPRPAGAFDLTYNWSIDGIVRRGTLPGLVCADPD